MSKADKPKERMQLSIEFADNGIILRNPEIEDDVTLAITGKGIKKENGYGYDIDHSEEFKAIGRKIYNWLVDVAFTENSDYWLSTGAELKITATLNGRER